MREHRCSIVVFINALPWNPVTCLKTLMNINLQIRQTYWCFVNTYLVRICHDWRTQKSHGQIQEEYQQLEWWWQLYGYMMSGLGLTKCLGTWHLLHRMYLQSHCDHFLPHPTHCSLVILPMNTKLMKICEVKLTTNKITKQTWFFDALAFITRLATFFTTASISLKQYEV